MIDVCLPVVVRVHAFRHLMCAWGALRHADHRGMNPDHFVLTKEGGVERVCDQDEDDGHR